MSKISDKNPTRFYWITAICFGGYFLLGHSVADGST